MSKLTAVVSCVIAGLAGTALATVADISASNGIQMNARVFNDFSDSVLKIDDTEYASPASFARAGLGTLTIDEQFPSVPGSGFANKHVGYVSTDGGATPHKHYVGQSFTVSFDISITAPAGIPRKEGAFRVENPRPGFTDEGLILVASDGEVAVFGGAMPFTGFGNVYTLGQTASLTFEYFAPGVADLTKGAYRLRFVDPVTGSHDSGVKVWGDETDGTVGFNTGTQFALVAQNQRNRRIADASEFVYSNISIVPAPTSAALLALAGLGAARRRR